jgi:hypothetical protein
MTTDTNNYEDIGELCVELERQNEQLANEVARLNNTLENTRISRATIIEDRNLLDQELAASNNEVARLRKYVELIEIFSPDNEWSQPEWRKLIGGKEENEDPETLFKLYEFRLAPALEEPYYPEQDLPTPDEEIAYAKAKEPAPEWRDLGPDEEIHTGDEVQAKHHDKINGKWQAAWSFEIGVKAGHFKAMRYRTRRPLPKQEGEQPYCSRCKYNHAFPCEGSLAGVPLEDELSAIEEGNPWIDPSKNILICIRYLRDEIEQLKKNQK